MVSHADAKFMAMVCLTTREHIRQHFLFPLGQGCESFFDSFGVSASGAAHFLPAPTPPRMESSSAWPSNGFSQEMNRSLFHCIDRQRNIAMRGDDDHRHGDRRSFIFSNKSSPVISGHAHVRHEATAVVLLDHIEECSRGFMRANRVTLRRQQRSQRRENSSDHRQQCKLLSYRHFWACRALSP